ncbi:MAG: MbnP family protein, partial [Bacteroidia bacterium]
VNAHGDTFTVSKFKYFISNLKLRRPDGTYFVEPESYHLVDAADSSGSCKLLLKNVPIGNYISMEFLIGIDSTRNVSGAQTGDLAQTDDMFWSWNQGYIFFKFEGYSYSAPPFAYNNLEYHVGGFTAPYNNIRTVSLPFTQNALIVDLDHVSRIYLKANVQEVFRNQYMINMGATPVVTTPSTARQISINYSHMFSVASVVH